MMMQYNLDLHVEYPDIYRYWSPLSEQYAGGDCLFAALYCGWTVNPVVYREEHWRSESRSVCVYHFELVQDGQLVTMPVIANPYINRLIRDQALEVQSIEERSLNRQRETSTLEMVLLRT
jgi:hypothetical protein